MKIEKLKPGMIVYDIRTFYEDDTDTENIIIWDVVIKNIDLKRRTVEASWNGNKNEIFYEYVWYNWKNKRPLLIKTETGAYRKATREEIKREKENIIELNNKLL